MSPLDEGFSLAKSNGFALSWGMNLILEEEANVTRQNQVTIPAAIRNVLQLRGGQSRVKFQAVSKGKETIVVIRVAYTKADGDHEDPALGSFLQLLEEDIRQHPERIKAFPAEQLHEYRSLVEGVEAEVDGPLTGED